MINDTNVGCYNKSLLRYVLSPIRCVLKHIKFGYTPVWELDEVVITPYKGHINKVPEIGIVSNGIYLNSRNPSIALLILRIWAPYKWTLVHDSNLTCSKLWYGPALGLFVIAQDCI